MAVLFRPAMSLQTHRITTGDHLQLSLEVTGRPGQPTVVVNPAIGVRRRLYREFANWLAEQGIGCVLYNYRGMEDGSQHLPAGADLSTVAWGQLDQSAVLDWVLNTLKPERLFLLGHSIGGQLVGFAKQLDQVTGIIHIAAQKGDQQYWSGSGRLKLFMLWHVLIPLMSRGPSFNAGKLGLGAYPWPSAAARQWAAWGRSRDYLFNPKFGYDLAPWRTYRGSLLSLGFTDDPMAPEAAIDGLLSEFHTARDLGHIEKRLIDPTSVKQTTIGHFGFFKPEASNLWEDLKTWIQQH
jgi:predicted alpha/beta hydrolase